MTTEASAAAPAPAAPLLRVHRLAKRYKRGGWLSARGAITPALRDLTLELPAGATLAVIGSSGAGKSTLARCLCGFERPDSGEIWWQGQNLLGLRGRRLRACRRQLQMIVQDPAAALNPRFSVFDIVTEPWRITRQGSAHERRQWALALLDQVGLASIQLRRLAAELSGGQRQRLALARALAPQPRLLVLDESLANLDLSIQAQMVNLLLELQARLGLAYLYISHDLTRVGHLADWVGVMEAGELVETTPAAEFFRQPRSPQGQRLLQSERAGT